MNYKEYKEAKEQAFNDPAEWNGKQRYCDICDIAEEKTYFEEYTNICLDCYEEKEEEEKN